MVSLLFISIFHTVGIIGNNSGLNWPVVSETKIWVIMKKTSEHRIFIPIADFSLQNNINLLCL